MANEPFDRTIINPRERPLSSDINQLQSQQDRTLRRLLGRLLATRTSASDPSEVVETGFLNQGFQLLPNGGMNLLIHNGLGFFTNSPDSPAAIGGIIGLDDLDGYKPLSLNADIGFTVPAAPVAPNNRIDILEIDYRRVMNNPLSRDVFDIGTETFLPGLVNKTLTWSLDGQFTINGSGYINYKTGVPGPGVPAVPTPSAGYIQIAQVYVAGNAITLPVSVIGDHRLMLVPGGITISGQYRAKESGAGGTNVTLLEVNAPPGVEVTITANGTPPPNQSINGMIMFINVKAGNNLLRRVHFSTSISSPFGGEPAEMYILSAGPNGIPPTLNVLTGVRQADFIFKHYKIINGSPASTVLAGAVGSLDEVLVQFTAKVY